MPCTQKHILLLHTLGCDDFKHRFIASPPWFMWKKKYFQIYLLHQYSHANHTKLGNAKSESTNIFWNWLYLCIYTKPIHTYTCTSILIHVRISKYHCKWYRYIHCLKHLSYQGSNKLVAAIGDSLLDSTHYQSFLLFTLKQASLFHHQSLHTLVHIRT